MTNEIPKWAYDRIRTEVPPEAEILNVVAIEKGRFSGAVLANTTRGAVLVTKSSLGEPWTTFLHLPGKVVTLTCSSCAQTTELHNPPTDASVHCSKCGKVQRLPSIDEPKASNGTGPKKATVPVIKG